MKRAIKFFFFFYMYSVSVANVNIFTIYICKRGKGEYISLFLFMKRHLRIQSVHLLTGQGMFTVDLKASFSLICLEHGVTREDREVRADSEVLEAKHSAAKWSQLGWCICDRDRKATRSLGLEWSTEQTEVLLWWRKEKNRKGTFDVGWNYCQIFSLQPLLGWAGLPDLSTD